MSYKTITTKLGLERSYYLRKRLFGARGWHIRISGSPHSGSTLPIGTLYFLYRSNCNTFYIENINCRQTRYFLPHDEPSISIYPTETMVTLPQVHASNAQIPTSLPPNLVAVFIGATSGIGEAALKEFVRNARSPKCYLVGRCEQAANRIIDECNALNPDASVVFLRADMSLVREADRLCETIIGVERVVDVLFLSAGAAVLDRSGRFSYLLFG